MKRTILTLAAAAATLFAGAALADAKTDSILLNLKVKYPATTFTGVRATPLQGIYEVQMGRNLAYVDESGRTFLFGSMYDMEARSDLTAARKTELGIQDAPAPQQQRAEAPPIKWSDLPMADAMVRVIGKGERKLALFSDPDCPFCRQLERELEKLDNVTIYTFLYPLASLHPGAPAKSENIWCAGEKARNKVWIDQMIGGKTPPAAKACATPLERNVALGDSLNVRGTPTMFTSDGRRISGAMPAARIDAWLNAGK
ncbi:DsbC family protein [Methylibium petroleiphilum]|nr:DsbC family protein [Methylibium petroleiphilum]